MSLATLRARLRAAALPLPLPSDEVDVRPLGSLVPWWGTGLVLSFRPSGTPSSAVPRLAARLGVEHLPAATNAQALHAMIPVPQDICLRSLLAEDPAADGNAVNRVWQLAREVAPGDAQVRASLVRGLSARWDDAKFEALVGLLVHGGGDEERDSVLGALSDDNAAVVGAAAAVLCARGLEEVSDAPAFERAVEQGDQAELLQQLLQMAQGDLSGAGELFAQGDWEARSGAFLFAGALLGRADTDEEELLQQLLSRLSDEDDSDCASVLSWALGRCVERGGLAVAEAVLEAASRCNDGSWQQGVALLSLLAMDSREEGAQSLLEAVRAFSTSDRDTRDVLNLVTASLQDGPVPWGAALRWSGVRTAIVNPWRRETPFLLRLLRPDARRERAAILGAVTSDEFWQDDSRARVIGWLLAQDPTAAPLLEEVARVRPERSAGPVAAALLLHDGAVDVDPVLARVEVGADVGGPLPDTPAVWGRLLRCMQESRLADSAQQLLRMCPGGVAVAESWFHASLRLGGDEDEAKKLLSFASELPPRRRSTDLDALESARVGAKVPAGALVSALRQRPREDRGALLGSLLGTITDRESLLALARASGGAQVDDADLLSAFWPLARHDSWVQREAAGALAQHVSEAALELADDVRERLVELCRDSDSDVRREARAASRRIGLDWREGEEEPEEADDMPF